MHKEHNNTPRRGPMRGPGPRGVGEKAKDFKGSMLRLLKELKSFRFLIVFSLALAALGSILSILTPNKLSDLTDEISKGLVVNTKNIEKITKNIANSYDQEKVQRVLPDILQVNFNENTAYEIISSKDITDSDKTIFQEKIRFN